MKIVARGLLLFWASWFSLVLASNLTDALQQLGVLSSQWRFVSGNFAMIRQSIAIYGLSPAMAALLFAGVLGVQLSATVLFWRAFAARDTITRPDAPEIPRAFAAGLAMFAGFLLADEAFVVYERFAGAATTHLLVFCALLLSFLTIRCGAK